MDGDDVGAPPALSLMMRRLFLRRRPSETTVVLPTTAPVLQKWDPVTSLVTDEHRQTTPLGVSGMTPIGVTGAAAAVPTGGTVVTSTTAKEKLRKHRAIAIAGRAGGHRAQLPRRPTATAGEVTTVEIHGTTGKTHGAEVGTAVEMSIGGVMGTAGNSVTTAKTVTADVTENFEGTATELPRQMVETNGHDVTIMRKIEMTAGRMVETTLPDGTIRNAYFLSSVAMMESGIPKTTKAGMQDVMRATTPVGADGIPASSPVIEKDIIKDLQEPGPPKSCKFRALVDAWKRMTMLHPSKQGLVLYQNLSGKAWIAAEELSLSKLGADNGVHYLESTARFLDLEITRIGRALSDFFRRLRRRQGQTVREYNTEYDRLYGCLREVGCCLPEECAAWVYLDRLQLEEPQELNLLASVGNKYDLLRLQQAAVLHDRGHRKPWESNAAKGRRTNYANMTDEVDHDGPDDETGNLTDGDEGIPEEVAQAWMTFRSVKDKYKAQQRNRGYQGDGERSRDHGGEPTLKQMKLKSFCSGCGRRGHWHKDPECPNNQGTTAGTKAGGGNDGGGQGRGGKDPAREVAMTTVLPASICALKHEGHSLMAVTDTACARTVAGTQWLQSYTDLLADQGERPALHKENEAYRFGTGKVHVSSFYIVVCFELGNKIAKVRTSIITGDVPLWLSKTVLVKLGMVFDVEKGKADFNKVGLTDYMLLTTPSGHPAIPIVPAKAGAGGTCTLQIDDLRLETVSLSNQHIRNFGLEELSFIRRPENLFLILPLRAMSSEPCQGPPPPISKMTKTQLLAESSRLGLVVHTSWTVEELRAIIREHRESKTMQDDKVAMRGLSSLTMPELKAKATELKVEFPSNITKGNLLRLIRDSVNTPGNELITFGKHRGKEYQEVPDAYGRWAVHEVNGNSNSSDDLVRFAKWWHKNRALEQMQNYAREAMEVPLPQSPRESEDLHRWRGYPESSTTSRTQDQRPRIPPFALEMDPSTPPKRTGAHTSGSSAAGSWEAVSVPSTKIGRGKGNAKTTKRPQETEDKPMESEIDPAVLEEIQVLQTRLALLKDKEIITDEASSRAYSQVEDVYANTHHEPQTDLCGGEGESAARIAYKEGDFTYARCQQVLDAARLPRRALRAMNDPAENDQDTAYVTLGVFVHGGVRGITTATKEYGSLARYLNGFARHHLQRGCKWSSISVTKNIASTVHRDSHNMRGSNNHCITLGQDGGGELWIESPGLTENEAKLNEIEWKLDKSGAWTPGQCFDTRENFVTFDPFLRHASKPWEGDRWGLVYHTVRGADEISEVMDKFIRNSGFPSTHRKKHTASSERSKFPKKSVRSSITNAAGKIGVLMTTLIVAANSYMTEICGPPPAPNPIVMMEIGGYEGTVEATELDKAVLEPMSWDDLKDSDLQETAHHFVIGASPKELRIHLRDMPASCFSFTKELIRTQLDEGGEVVLRGEVPGNLTDDFKEDVSFFTSGDEDHMDYDLTKYTRFMPKIDQRPTTLPRLLDFNTCVGVDLFYVHDINDKCHTFLSMVDWATTYHVVCRVESESAEDVEKAFNKMWLGPFGPPTMVSLDLDPKKQSGMSRLCDWHTIRVKDVAAQAHWQAGVTERQGGWFKGIWDRVVQELSVAEDEVELAGALVCAAKNDLRRLCGHSPSQWVFGKSPRLPPELNDLDSGEAVSWDLTRDSQFQRATIDSGEPSFNEEELDGSVLELWSENKFLTMKGVKREVEKLLAEDIDDPDVFSNDEPEEDVTKKAAPDNEDYSDHLSDYEPSDYDNGITLEGVLPDDGQQSDTPMPDLVTPSAKRRKYCGEKFQKKPDLFKEAERKQWLEHVDYDALEAMSVEESDRVRATVPPSRILRSRWAYKDKNWAARQAGNDPEWRCKSRLIIGGHLDPDLVEKDLTTDAPTLSRPGFMCLMQLLANGQHAQDVWEVAAGDIQCAFLTGGYLNRDEPLYLHQPTTGFPGLLPQQLVKIKKNIFGLATSPHEWWEDLQKGIKRTPITYNGRTYGWDQCPLDPCIFMLREYDNGKFHGKPIGYLGTHVDDILVVVAKSVSDLIKDALSRTFPIDKWEVNRLDYIGSEIVVENGEVKVSQTKSKYVETRLFTIDIPRGVCEEDLADPETAADNKSLIGALSWLSAQTRPDLTCSVSISQQLQKSPTYGDVKFSNVVASRAMSYKHHGLVFRGIDPSKAVFMVYHDAAWANVLEENEPGFELTEEDYRAGLQLEGPYSKKERKAKRINSKVASQIGALVLIADIESVRGGRGNMSVSDWKSRAGQRVCRSTFGAETQASVEGLEAAQYMRSFFETVIKGELVKVECATTPLLCLSDCRSLYDHIHKEGLPRVASDRRLAIDLAALRQGLRWERWYPKLPMAWVPSALQLADVLTKPKDPHDWWDMMCSRLTVAIEVGEQSRANVLKEGEEVTSVEHKVSSGIERTVHFLSDYVCDELH
ncbi:unnamed protein product [Symbiodinium sp. CCMP2592]|nr:unnamed protein product [Symbiodinium sp. CCMP2592]